MLPKLIVHNSVSLDGAIDGFELDLYLHYGIVAGFGAEASLVGSITSLTGLEMFGCPAETEADLHRPDDASRKGRAWWLVPDSTGRLLGKLHGLRSSEYCRDAVVLVTDQTPAAYLDYLRERDYRHHVLGKDRVDLRAALELAAEQYGARTMYTDCGPRLVAALLERQLVDQISLVIAPALAGPGHRKLFEEVRAPVPMKLASQREEKGFLVTLYDVKKG